MAMESALFIGEFRIETTISSGFPLATFDYRMVSSEIAEPSHRPNAVQQRSSWTEPMLPQRARAEKAVDWHPQRGTVSNEFVFLTGKVSGD